MGLNQRFLHNISDFGTSVMRLFPAEMAHNLGIFVLKNGLQKALPRPSFVPSLDLSIDLPGIGSFEHPIGLAAGFDKNAAAVMGFHDLGFSFIEVGTVTPRPQQGNPKPRLFRYPEQSAIVNRMGFNNDGMSAMRARFQKGQFKDRGVTVGINVGKNKDTPLDHAITDYITSLRELEEFGSYFVINISSPNTPGLRDLASKEFLKALSTEISNLNADMLKRVWVKVDPDLEKNHFQEVVEVISKSGFAGIILTNTHRVEKPQVGGQSGHPVGVLSTLRLEWAHEVTGGSLPMIGVGGIMSGGDIYQKIIRGSSACQIYTAMVYRGPWAVQKLLEELEWELKLHGHKSLKEAQGTYYK